jgi:hypothetical protein
MSDCHILAASVAVTAAAQLSGCAYQPVPTYGYPMTIEFQPVNEGTTLLYLGSKRDCAPCRLKAQCCQNTRVRRIPRCIYERAPRHRAITCRHRSIGAVTT